MAEYFPDRLCKPANGDEQIGYAKPGFDLLKSKKGSSIAHDYIKMTRDFV